MDRKVLLQRLLAEPYLRREPPKSTGRDLFNDQWLTQLLASFPNTKLEPVDVQASLAEFSVMAAANALLYPSLAIPLMKIWPSAAMSATAVPEMPENMIAARIAA